MNNKFIKRVAAVVLGVAVLSTCAFAASVTGGYRSEKLYFTLDTTADKVSYIAYASDAEGATNAIVAIGQIDDASTSTEKVSLPISASLLGDATHILIKSGDTNGSVAEQLIPASAYAATVNFVENSAEERVIQGDTFKNALEYTLSVTFNTPGSVKVNKLIVNNGSREITGANLNGLANTVFETGSSANVNFYLAGVPEEVINAGVELDADCTFTPAN